MSQKTSVKWKVQSSSSSSTEPAELYLIIVSYIYVRKSTTSFVTVCSPCGEKHHKIDHISVFETILWRYSDHEFALIELCSLVYRRNHQLLLQSNDSFWIMALQLQNSQLHQSSHDTYVKIKNKYNKSFSSVCVLFLLHICGTAHHGYLSTSPSLNILLNRSR